MIDHFEQAIELMEDMRAELPIAVQPTPELLQTLKNKSRVLPAEDEWRIDFLFYAGDEGGIVCGIELPKERAEAVVVSLTHLRIDHARLLSQRIRKYQSKRAKKLARQSRDVPPR